MYRCYKCDFKVSTMASLGAHLSQVHGKNTKCEKCGYFSEKIAFMRKHERRCYQVESHTYKCDYCDYMSFSKPDMKKHLKKCQSQSTKLYQCTKCDFKASADFLVTMHISKVHGGYSKCPYCPYEHECLRTVRKHEKKCAGKESTCTRCNTTFSVWNYQRHRKFCHSFTKHNGKGKWIVKLRRLDL